MGEAFQIKDQELPYFMTFQVVGWLDVFTRSDYRDHIIESFKYCREEKGMLLYAYVIMTNHIHVIMQSKSGSLSDLVRDFKKFTSKKPLEVILENPIESRKEWMKMVFSYHAKYNKRSGGQQFWTRENHSIELATSEMIESRMNYIHENPVRARYVEMPEDYLYSSARNYSGRYSLLEIDLI